MPLTGIRKTMPTARLSNMFETAVLCRPSNQAILDVETNTGLTFIELSEKVNKMARFLLKVTSEMLENISDHFERESLLFAICMSHSTELIICLLAILKLEAAYVPIDICFSTSRIEYILNDSKPNVILINGKIQNLEAAKINEPKIIDLKETWPLVEEENCEAIHLESYLDDPLFSIIYTSGSTGTPKGVKLSSNGVLNRMIWQWDAFPYSKEEIICFKTELSFVDSIPEIYGTLLTGHKLLITPKRMVREVEELVNLLAQHHVNRIMLVPTLLRSILFHCSRTENESLPHLRLWICSGEVLQCDLIEEFFRTFPNDEKEIYNVYGCTEGHGDSTYSSFNKSSVIKGVSVNVPLGIPIFNSDVYLINNKMEEVTEGSIGEIMISGKNVCLGYVGMEKSEKFIWNIFNKGKDYELLYRTGDYGMISNGLLYYQGRMDSQIKIRGHRIDLMEVENYLQNIEGVTNALVLCYHTGKIEQMLLSFYTSSGSELCLQKVRSELERQLPTYMVPQVYKIDNFPLLVNGKIDRQQLLQIHEEKHKDIQDKSQIIVNNCPIELREVAEILLLSTIKSLGPSSPDVISLDDDYLQIGGNSLNILTLLGYLQDMGYFIGTQDFIAASNFREVLSKLTLSLDEKDNIFGRRNPKEDKYKTRPIMLEDADDVMDILASSLANKNLLDISLRIPFDVIRSAIQSWPFGDASHSFGQLSFVLYEVETGEIVGVTVNTDLNEDLEFDSSDWGVIMVNSFIEYCEKEAMVNFRGEKVLHAFLMGTKNTISTLENINLVHIMELNTVEIAKRYNYDSIITTNTSQATQQMCQLMNYKVLGNFRVNTWISNDESLPFKNVPDDLSITVEAKYI